MSLVSRGWHYIRDGGEAESLYNLASDPGESLNVLRTPQDLSELLNDFRRSILRVLTHDPAMPGAEADRVKRYRRRLEALVESRSPSDLPTSAEP
jgi:hypothetical protein